MNLTWSGKITIYKLIFKKSIYEIIEKIICVLYNLYIKSFSISGGFYEYGIDKE